jgi:hypothetical protein
VGLTNERKLILVETSKVMISDKNVQECDATSVQYVAMDVWLKIKHQQNQIINLKNKQQAFKKFNLKL